MTEKKKVGRPKNAEGEKKVAVPVYRMPKEIVQLGGIVRVKKIVNNFLDRQIEQFKKLKT
jgi:hypothetical protein